MDRIFALGALYPVTFDDLSLDPGMGIGAFFHAASGVHRRLSDFIHAVVVCRRDVGFPSFVAKDKGIPALRNSILRWRSGCLFYLRVSRLIGQMLADVVQRKGVSAGSLDGWEWRELKVLPVSWYVELARILAKVEDFGVWA